MFFRMTAWFKVLLYILINFHQKKWKIYLISNKKIQVSIVICYVFPYGFSEAIQVLIKLPRSNVPSLVDLILIWTLWFALSDSVVLEIKINEKYNESTALLVVIYSNSVLNIIHGCIYFVLGHWNFLGLSALVKLWEKWKDLDKRFRKCYYGMTCILLTSTTRDWLSTDISMHSLQSGCCE